MDGSTSHKGDLFRVRMNATGGLHVCFGQVAWLLDPSLVCNGHGNCNGQDNCICCGILQ